MIFKTFQAELDGISNKIGFNKRSFAEWGKQVSISFKESKSVINSFKNALKTAFTVPRERKDWTKNKYEEIVDKDNIDSYISKLKEEDASGLAQKIREQSVAVAEAKDGWEDYFAELKNNSQGYIVDLIKNTHDLSKLTGEDLVKANQKARESAIAHNEQIKNMSLSAKAGKVVFQSLAMAGNMLAFTLISKGIELAAKGIDRVINSAKYAEKAFKDATDSAKTFTRTIKDTQKNTANMESSVNSIIDRYAKLSQGVNPFTNENTGLSTQEYEEFLDLNEQLADLFPSLTMDYDENGKAILGLSGSVDSVTESIRALVEQQKELAKADIRENVEQYFNGTKDAPGAWKALEGRKQAVEDANKELETMQEYYDTMLHGGKWRIHEDLAPFEKGAYLIKIRDYFGEDIASILESVMSVEYNKGFLWHYADVIIDSTKLTETQKEQITESYDTFYSELLAKQKTATSELESQNAEFSNNALFWLEDLSFYEDSEIYVKTAMQRLVKSIDWSSYDPEALNYEGVKAILQNAVLTPFQVACNDPDQKAELTRALSDLFSVNPADMRIDTLNDAFNTLAAILRKNPLELKVALGFESENDIKDRLNGRVLQLLDGKYTSKLPTGQPFKINDEGIKSDEYASWLNATKDFTIGQAELFLKTTRDAENIEQALEKWNAKLAEMAKEYEDSNILSTKLTNSADSLDAFQSSVKSAVDAYATLLSGNYSSTDLLNSIQAINKAATDMGKSIRWEEIDSLDALGDQIEEISQAYADSVLSDAGLSKDSKFGQMLTDIIRASYQSEAALSSLNTQIDSLQDSYRNLNDIVDTYNEHGHITFDQLQTLLDMEPRYLSCLVSEDGQLRLNQDAMQELAAMRLADAKALIIQQAVTELGELAQKREKKAVEDNTMALTDNMETLTTYERRIIDLLPGLGLTGNEFCRISNAINGAMQDGASDEDIDEVLRNAAKKVKFITGMADGNIDDMFGGFSSAAVSATEELNSYLDAQEKALDAGKISFREYCDSISSHIRKAYDNGKISAKEFWDYQGQFLEKQKSSYDKVISAVTRKLDGEIDALRDRQDEIDGFYESQISSLEETRKLLQENNDERKRQADLQKALYEMERAHNQRTVLQYSEGMGMHYVSDPNAVRDAENSVADARLNIRTAEIDSAISRLERQRDSEKSAIDEIIRNLEAYKAKWSEVSSAFEEAQEDQLAAEILGQEWEADVLGMRIDTLSAFAENYVNLQRTIADAAWESAKAQAEAQKLINEQTSDAPGNRSAAIKKVADYGAGIANALRDKFDLSKHPLKFHTGLKQGLVDTPSLNRDFKLVQDVGLGRNEVPAVLKKGEIVATQEQVSNLAAGLRQAGSQTILVNGMELRALQPGDETYDLMQKWDTYFGRIDGNVEKLLPSSFFEQREQVTASANHIVSNNVESHNRDVQPTIHNEIHVTLPNVTNATSAETLLKDLQSLGTKKLQVNW